MSGLSKGVTALVRPKDVKDTWFAGTFQGVFRSEDLTRWTECSSGLENGSIRDLIATPDGDLIALAAYGRLYRSQDGCRSWWPLTAPTPRLVNVNVSRTPPLLASDDALGLVLFGDGIAQLSRDQRTWVVRATSPAITAFARDGQGRYWLGTHDGVSRLSVEEPAWKLIPAGLDGRISALAIDPDGYLLAAVDNRGMFRARVP
jgi:ligand-binding sensor domain-containing protein